MKRWAILLTLLWGGCTLAGTEWERPLLHSPEAWSLPLPPMEAGTETEFWARWGDPQLLEWLQRTATENRDMRLAAARIREARTLARIANADRLPTLDADSSLTRELTARRYRPPMPGIPNPLTLHQVGLDARWELDLFGRLFRQQEAAEAEWIAANLLQSALKISLSAEVATTYWEWRAAQAKAETLQRQAEASRSLLALVRSRVRAGLNPELDLHRAEEQTAQTEARLPPVQAAAGLALRRLGILTGGQPDSLLTPSSPQGVLPARVPPLPSVLPAELLDRRPDLLAAEARAQAAHARIGVAEGEKWPRLTLAATVGSFPVGSGSFLSGDSSFYTLGPRLHLPLFRGEALDAQVDAARARTEQEILAWEKAAMEALLEVETAALHYQEARERHSLLVHALRAQRQALELATLRYQKGLSDFSVPLDVVRQVTAMEMEVIDAHQSLLSSGIALYKALGGGWKEEGL